MKKLISICLLLLSLSLISRAQNPTPPEFPGGKKAFHDFLEKNLKNPATNEMQGAVIIGFTVERDGHLTNIAVKKSLAPAYDKEALRVIALSPAWIPAMQDRKIIKSIYTVPIMFSAQDIYVKSDIPSLRPKESELRVAPPIHDAGIVIDEPVGNSTANNPPDMIYTSVEKAPQFPGGIMKFYDYIKDGLKKERLTASDQGRVIITFVVERDGSLTDIRVVRSVSTASDAAAVRLLKTSPKWEPGIAGGKPVRVAYSVPVTITPNI